MGVQDAAVATSHSGTDSSPANSANTDTASNKPLMLVALSATEAVGWDDLEAKVSTLYVLPTHSSRVADIRDAFTKGRELTQHLSRPVSGLRKPLAAASASTPSPPATRHGR